MHGGEKENQRSAVLYVHQLRVRVEYSLALCTLLLYGGRPESVLNVEISFQRPASLNAKIASLPGSAVAPDLAPLTHKGHDEADGQSSEDEGQRPQDGDGSIRPSHSRCLIQLWQGCLHIS